MPDIPQPDTVVTVERRLDSPPQGQGRGGSRGPANRAVETYAETARVAPGDDRVTILGIPFEQITPATQAALAGLVAEINYLRGLVKRYERGGQRKSEEAATILEPAAFGRALDATLAKEPPDGDTWVAVMVHVATYEDIRRSSGVLAANATLADVAARLRDVELPLGDGHFARLICMGYAGGSNLAGLMTLPQQDLDAAAVADFLRKQLLSGAYNVAGIEMTLALTCAVAAVGPGESGLLALARTDHLLLRKR